MPPTSERRTMSDGALCLRVVFSGPSSVTNLSERSPGRGSATRSRAARRHRTSRIPIPPALPNRAPAGLRRSADPAPRSVRTCRASTRRGSWESSSDCILRADARSTRARRPPFSGGGRSGPAFRAGRGGAIETGIPKHAQFCERPVPARCFFRGPGASTPTEPRRSAPRRDAAARSRAFLPSMKAPTGAAAAVARGDRS